MKICNFGSINIDHVYTIPHFVRAGETIDSSSYSIYPGGKGLNQSIALARSGSSVYHAGAVGKEDTWLLEMMQKEGINTENVLTRDNPGGHAVIQVSPSGENAIFIHGGANRSFTRPEIRTIMDCFSEGDYLLLQNEINEIPFIIETAHKKKLKIVLNPAPMTDAVHEYPLQLVDMLIVNQIEGEELACQFDPEKIVHALNQKYSDASIVLTLGSGGAMFCNAEHGTVRVPAYEVESIDTTGAGDTFTGYLVGALCSGIHVTRALEKACRAASICVTRPGAAGSIPFIHELDV